MLTLAPKEQLFSGGGYDPRSFYPNQGMAGFTSQGQGTYSAPGVWDRVGRGAQGAINGYDFGHQGANIGADLGAAFVPGGQVVNSAAGAIQGASSNRPDFDAAKMPWDITPTSTGSGFTPDVLPRGGYETPGGQGMPGLETPRGFNGGASTGAAGFAANPISGRPPVAGQPGGSPDLLSLLSSAQRYGDPSDGRSGYAGGATGAGGYSYSGFDFAQDPGNRDMSKSAKYAFSQFAEDAARQGAPMPRTKAEAESWFTQYIAPRMQQAGYAIEWVQGDKARIATREGVDEIDFLINADGENPSLGWQSEVLAPGGGMSTGPQGMGGGAPQGGLDLSSSALFEQLMQQVRDIAAGKPTGPLVTDSEALRRLFPAG
jgi:hypothetical protein